ncbi:signal transduction histidine kinase [Methanobacterium lacus]|uniref:Signal transduction histidine kinase n=1 Tax=Methanobacterium lacus (strain AL-21) TaxID=877455 RepID=F0T978_METLA|nr:histidine kinase dimerization/phosphoacceptor domain -containing protein [Methanobacterium lacus]ADZ08700.1 signal transduction histidine kinase [Methanobacterium lacus]
MNIYSYVSLSAFFLCFFLGNFIYHKNSRSQLNIMIAVLCFLVGFLAFTEFQYRQTTDFQTAYLWLKLSGLWPLVPPVILHISLIFTGKTEVLKNKLTYLLMYVPAIIISIYAVTTNLLLQGILKEYWGWTYIFPQNSAIFNVMSIWTLTCVLIAGGLCLFYYVRTRNVEKLQAKYLIAGLYFPLIISMVSDLVLPSMSIRIPETTIVMSTVGLSFISYGVWKYRFPALTAAIAADEIVSTMSSFLIMLDPQMNVVNINKATTELFGYGKSEIIGKPVKCLFAEKTMTLKDLLDTSTDSIINIETVIKTKNGSSVPVIISKSVIRSDMGTVLGIVCIGNNIIDIKNAEDKIKTSLQEKELLLRELHHRVKNNLQIISSLINLQSQGIKNKEDLEIFRESQSRVKSMAIIHEKLYQSTDLSNINFRDYIQSLVSYLVSYYSKEMIKIEMDVNEDLVLNMDTAVPCGLIINELFINSLKHAFEGRSNGRITIKLSLDDETPECYVLEVADNGVGLPPDVDLNNPQKLGLQLVVSLTNQLDGKIFVDTKDGTKFTIKFRELIYKQRLIKSK